MKSLKPRKTEISFRNARDATPLKIVHDAAISIRGLNGGRLIPLVILDTSERPDVDEFIRVHQTAVNLGDVKIQWGGLGSHEGTVALFLIFIRPSEVTIVLEFDIVNQGIIVEQALFGRAIYLQAGREGDRFSKNPDRPKVMVEIADTGFRDIWDELFRNHLQKHFRAEGLSRPESRRATKTFTEELRKITSGCRLHDLTE